VCPHASRRVSLPIQEHGVEPAGDAVVKLYEYVVSVHIYHASFDVAFILANDAVDDHFFLRPIGLSAQRDN